MHGQAVFIDYAGFEETIFPHIQHACGSFELAATSRLQLAR
jgi:hypothetical protein